MSASDLLSNLYMEKIAYKIGGYRTQNVPHSNPMTLDEVWDRNSAVASRRFENGIKQDRIRRQTQQPQPQSQQAQSQPQQQPQPQPQSQSQQRPQPQQPQQNAKNKALEDQTGVPVYKPSGEKPNIKTMVDAGSIEGPSRKRQFSNQDIQSQLDSQVKSQPQQNAAAFNKVTGWIKNNPGKAAIGTTAVAGTAALAYGIHKLKQQKKQEEQNNQQYAAYNQPMYHTASSYLDELVFEKQASVDVEDVAAQVPEQIVPDEASMMEKIVEAVKYNKPQKTPGGKVTPSKFVQRKNKERFKA